MSTGLYSGVSGLAIGSGLWKAFPGLWSGATGLIDLPQTLSLNFLSGAPLDSRITFSRGSQATLTDSTGKITYAPNNVITNSVGPNASVGTAVTMIANGAPDGTSGIRLSKTDATTPRYCNWTTSFTVQGDTGYIASAYFKYDGYDTTVSLEYNNVNHWGRAWVASFNVTSSGITANAPSSCTSGVQSVGNGWFRVWAAFTSGTPSAPTSPTILTRITGGSGTSVLVAWGQIEAVTYQTTPGTYNSTTPKNLLGYTQEFDNAAWTKSNSFVQTNLTSYSEQFDNAYWQTLRGTITANVETSPAGNSTADKFTEDATTNTRSTATSAITITSGATYTGSCYLKNIDRRYVSLLLMDQSTGLNGFLATFDLQNGTATTQSRGTGTVTSASIVNVGGGWYRCSVTGTAPTTTALFFVSPATTATPVQSTYGRESYLGDGVKSFLLWGAQLVQGATAGNYQPTYAAAAAVQYPAPDNSLTADKLVENTANAKHQISNTTAVTVVLGQIVTFSFYAKAAERSRVYVECSTGIFGANITQFNLTGSGSVISGQGTITDVGGGWYRCSSVLTATAGGSAVCYIITGDGSSSTYTGDGTSGIYIWGAQLSNSASLDPYVYNPGAAPTSAAYYGPRFDYDPVTLAAKGLLIEEQRTNLVTYSADGTPVTSWASLGTGITTANTGTAPDGTNTAFTVSNADNVNPSSGNNVYKIFNVSSNTAYTISLYVKAITATTVSINIFDGSTGANTSQAIALTSSWQRVQVTRTSGASTTGMRFSIGSANGTVLCWGAQAEAGSFATSYIPTVASTVTRSADVALMQGANFSNWWNQNEGTLASSVLDNSIGSRVLTVSDGTVNNQIFMNTSTDFVLSVYTGGVYQAQIGTTPAAPYKISGNYATNNFAAVANGGTVATDTSGSIASYSRMQIGANSAGTSQFLNGHIRSISYYNTRLGNATLQALTV